ncbi:MAG: carbohydrate ABC transporter permease [Clostridiaceae bacterium]|nr:carbohydrate ABC transporter permease [Clostridiaceae bacterium]
MTGKIKKLKKIELFDVINVIVLTLLMLIVLIPFYYTIIKSFMTQQEFVMNTAAFWPSTITFKNYKDVFYAGNFPRAFTNSVIYTLAGVLWSMFLTSTLAYGLSKKNYPYRSLIQNLVIFTMYFSGGLIPFFLVVKSLGLINTRFAAIIPLGLSIFNVIIMRNFFEQLPPDLEEAAMLDGANPIRIFLQISLPLVKPALATLTLFYAVDRWNEWFFSGLFLGDGSLWPVQLLLRQILWATGGFMKNIPPEAGKPTFSEGIKSASVILTMLPIMMVYPFLQKYFIKGVMIGAVKS